MSKPSCAASRTALSSLPGVINENVTGEGTDDAPVEVRSPVVRVDWNCIPSKGQGDGVDGEVALGEVILDGAADRAEVYIRRVVSRAEPEDAPGSVQRVRLPTESGGGAICDAFSIAMDRDVQVESLPAEQAVAYGAAYQIGLEALRREEAPQGFRGGR